jgi:hypothetical protein
MPADDPSQPANGLVRSQQAWERANWAANTAGRSAARAERRRRRPDGVITAEYATPNIVHVGSKACQSHLAVSGTDAIAAKARSAPPSAPADESMIDGPPSGRAAGAEGLPLSSTRRRNRPAPVRRRCRCRPRMLRTRTTLLTITMLGVLAGHLYPNRRFQWRDALGARYHPCLFR